MMFHVSLREGGAHLGGLVMDLPTGLSVLLTEFRHRPKSGNRESDPDLRFWFLGLHRPDGLRHKRAAKFCPRWTYFRLRHQDPEASSCIGCILTTPLRRIARHE